MAFCIDLISCDNCGVLLDRTKLNFPELENSVQLNIHQFVYDKKSGGYVAKIKCPVCSKDILNRK